MSRGLKRDVCLDISGVTKDQLYYSKKGTKGGKPASQTTAYRNPITLKEERLDNTEVVKEILEIKLDPDQSNYYKLITKRLNILGYYINHKKVYRLMKERDLLEKRRKRLGRTFVKYRRVCPTQALETLEMDIKYVWVEGTGKYAFILTVIDTFTRYVLDWEVGYSMKSDQVKKLWEKLIIKYLQPKRQMETQINIEIRNDNGKQFCSKIIMDFFTENNLDQVFTHPYTPEENGHVESFHKTLGMALKNDCYSDIVSLEKRLEKFYETYNNIRTHGSILGLSPSIFWKLFEINKIEIIPLEKRKQKFKLNMAYQDIMTLPIINEYNFG